MFGEQSDQRQMQMNYFGAISDVFTPKVIIESETEQKRQTSLNYSHFKRIITYINELLWKRINKPKEVIAETNRLRKVRSMLLTRVRDNILKSKEQKNIQPTKGGHKMVTCQNYVSLFYRQITSCPSDGGIS